MKICEDCIKQDVCKFIEEPLMCEYKRTDTFTIDTTFTPTYPAWDVGDYPLAPQVTWC